MTPELFAHNANAWMASLSSLAAPLIGLVGSVLGILAYIKSKTNELRLNGHSNELTTLMLNSPPTVEVVPAAAEVVPAVCPAHSSILPILRRHSAPAVSWQCRPLPPLSWPSSTASKPLSRLTRYHSLRPTHR